MLGSFRVLRHQHQGVEIKEFHSNLWFLSPKEVYLDTGLWFDFDQETFFDSDSFVFTLHVPFIIKDAISDLYDKICNDKILQLLHNEDYNHGTVKVGQTTINFVEFHFTHRGSFLILRPELTKIADTSIKIELKLGGLTKNALITGRFLENVDDQKTIGVYVRFRYAVRISGDSNINISADGFHKKLLVDLRINDIRSGESSLEVSDLVEVRKFMFFLILPSSYEVLLESSQAHRYVRMLEQEWTDYIKYKADSKLLVYYWRRDGLKSDSFNLLVGAKQEKDTYRPLLVSLILLASIGISIYIGDKLHLIAGFGRIAPFLKMLITWSVWLVTGVVLLIMGNALWDLLKYLYGNFRRSIHRGT